MPTLSDKLRTVCLTGPLILLTTAVLGAASILVSVFDGSGVRQHRLARLWSRVLARVAGVVIEVEGHEKIAPGGSYVFVANHRSFADIPAVLPCISVQFRFLAIRYLYQWPFIGFHLRRAGHLLVNEENPRQSLKSMTAAARIIQERGISVLVFPEGARTNGELGPFKDGAAYIAIKAGVPVVPIAIHGTREILPVGAWAIRGGKVRIVIGDPVPTIDLHLPDRARLTETLRQALASTHQPRP